jgi:hypothetical protein
MVKASFREEKTTMFRIMTIIRQMCNYLKELSSVLQLYSEVSHQITISFSDIGLGTPGLTPCRQALHHLNHARSLFILLQ